VGARSLARSRLPAGNRKASTAMRSAPTRTIGAAALARCRPVARKRVRNRCPANAEKPAASVAQAPKRWLRRPVRCRRAKHVLLLSVDGLHQSDLDWYVSSAPATPRWQISSMQARAMPRADPPSRPTLSREWSARSRRQPTHHRDLYDDTFNRTLLPAGTTNCAAATPGAEVAYTEAADLNPDALDAGQGIPRAPRARSCR